MKVQTWKENSSLEFGELPPASSTCFPREIPFQGGQMGIFLQMGQHPMHPFGSLGYVGC